MSPAATRAAMLAGLACDCAGARHGTDGGSPHFRMGAHGPEPVCNAGGGAGPCCDDPRWPECRDCPHYPRVSRLLHLMDEQRPPDAPPLSELDDAEAAEACQIAAFEAGDDEWWRYGDGFALYEADGSGGWRIAGQGDDADTR